MAQKPQKPNNQNESILVGKTQEPITFERELI